MSVTCDGAVLGAGNEPIVTSVNDSSSMKRRMKWNDKSGVL